MLVHERTCPYIVVLWRERGRLPSGWKMLYFEGGYLHPFWKKAGWFSILMFVLY